MDLRLWLQNNLETFQFGDDDRPYIQARALVEGLGLSWEAQRAIFRRDDHWQYREQDVAGPAGSELMGGLPADRLVIFLKTIDPERVRPEVRAPLIAYQETSREMTKKAFLNSTLLEAARAKDNPSPLEQKLIQAAAILEQQQGDG